MEQLATAGQQILTLMQMAAYWVTLIAGTGQVIACLSKRDAQGAVKNALTYGTAFASVYMLVWILDLVKGVFA